jgi:hypothetical protein
MSKTYDPASSHHPIPTRYGRRCVDIKTMGLPRHIVDALGTLDCELQNQFPGYSNDLCALLATVADELSISYKRKG